MPWRIPFFRRKKPEPSSTRGVPEEVLERVRKSNHKELFSSPIFGNGNNPAQNSRHQNNVDLFINGKKPRENKPEAQPSTGFPPLGFPEEPIEKPKHLTNRKSFWTRAVRTTGKVLNAAKPRLASAGRKTASGFKTAKAGIQSFGRTAKTSFTNYGIRRVDGKKARLEGRIGKLERKAARIAAKPGLAFRKTASKAESQRLIAERLRLRQARLETRIARARTGWFFPKARENRLARKAAKVERKVSEREAIAKALDNEARAKKSFLELRAKPKTRKINARIQKAKSKVKALAALETNT